MESPQMRGRLGDEFRLRTKGYAAGVIRLYVKLPKTREEVRILGKQLLRSGTSVAAHIREASRARSNEEFVSKLGGALQETDESALWLEFLREECGIVAALTAPLEKESSELIAIFTTMINRTEIGKSRKLKSGKLKFFEYVNSCFLLSQFQLSAFSISAFCFPNFCFIQYSSI